MTVNYDEGDDIRDDDDDDAKTPGKGVDTSDGMTIQKITTMTMTTMTTTMTTMTTRVKEDWRSTSLETKASIKRECFQLSRGEHLEMNDRLID